MFRPSLLFVLLLLVAPLRSQTVHVITIDGPITPATAEFCARAIGEATEAGSEALVIRLDTPGGLLQATRSIVSDILESDVPVIVYVAPAGAQAGSAGIFITMAGHVAAMTPGTNIGAAHPVGMQGSADSIMNEKATNDAAAFIRAIAQRRDRNLAMAEDAVRKSIALSDSEAVASNVVDLQADNLEDLLQRADGRTVSLPPGDRTLRTSGAAVTVIEQTLAEELLSVLSDPNIAYILFLLGVYGLLFELYNPGAILPGVVGGMSLILAFYALQTLPVSYAGVALIIFSIILFILELKITSHGLLGIGATISLLIGSAMLIKPSSGLEFVELSWSLIIFAVALTAFFFLFVIGLGIKAQRGKPTTGSEELVGSFGTADSRIDPEGTVLIHGERWRAVTEGAPIKKGARVRIQRVERLTLIVEQPPTPSEPAL